MKKSVAYLAGFQAGFDEKLGLEKAAGLVELLEFEPENAQQAEEFLRKQASLLDWLKRIRAVGVGKPIRKRSTGLKPFSGVGTVRKPGETVRTYDNPAIRGSTDVELSRVERSARPKKSG